MTNHISGMPLWAIVLFIPAFLLSIAFISRPVSQAAIDAGMTRRKANNIRIGIFVFYFIYLVYVSVLSLTGVFDTNAIVPKVAPMASLPLMVILFGIIGNTGLFRKLLRSATLESLIVIHTFRVVGVFFILLYYYHLLPAEFAFSAEMGDVITALLALPVAMMVRKRKPGHMVAVYAWNIFGMLDIVNILVIAGVTGASGNLREMTIFPFVWFPAFAPPTILFLHTIVFRKLYQLRRSRNAVAITV